MCTRFVTREPGRRTCHAGLHASSCSSPEPAGACFEGCGMCCHGLGCAAFRAASRSASSSNTVSCMACSVHARIEQVHCSSCTCCRGHGLRGLLLVGMACSLSRQHGVMWHKVNISKHQASASLFLKGRMSSSGLYLGSCPTGVVAAAVCASQSRNTSSTCTSSPFSATICQKVHMFAKPHYVENSGLQQEHRGLVLAKPKLPPCQRRLLQALFWVPPQRLHPFTAVYVPPWIRAPTLPSQASATFSDPPVLLLACQDKQHFHKSTVLG